MQTKRLTVRVAGGSYWQQRSLRAACCRDARVEGVISSTSNLHRKPAMVIYCAFVALLSVRDGGVRGCFKVSANQKSYSHTSPSGVRQVSPAFGKVVIALFGGA